MRRLLGLLALFLALCCHATWANPDTHGFLHALGDPSNTGNAVDYVLVEEGSSQYGVAVIEDIESTVHYVYLLRTRQGRWRYVAVGGGSVTGIPDVEAMARDFKFPATVARRLGKVGDPGPTHSVQMAIHFPQPHPLWEGLSKAKHFSVSDERSVIDYLIVRSGHLQYAVTLTPVVDDDSLRGYWYQVFQGQDGQWTQLARKGPLKEPTLDVGGWLRSIHVPASALPMLSRVGDPSVALQWVP